MRLTLSPDWRKRPTFDVEVGKAGDYPGGEEDQWLAAVACAEAQLLDWISDGNMEWYEE